MQMMKQLGITLLLKPFRWFTNTKRRLKRNAGYESDVGRLIRNGLPKLGGCVVVIIAGVLLIDLIMACFAA